MRSPKQYEQEIDSLRAEVERQRRQIEEWERVLRPWWDQTKCEPSAPEQVRAEVERLRSEVSARNEAALTNTNRDAALEGLLVEVERLKAEVDNVRAAQKTQKDKLYQHLTAIERLCLQRSHSGSQDDENLEGVLLEVRQALHRW